MIEFEVVLDRPWKSERTIRLQLDKYELIPLGCEDELDYLFKEISPSRLKQVVRTAIPNEEFYVSGVYITVIK